MWEIGGFLKGDWCMLDQYSDILTVKETEEILKISKKSVYRLIKSKELLSKKVGKVYRIPKKSVCNYILGEEQ